MLCLRRQNHQIIRIIVSEVSINMMDNLTLSKSSSKFHFCDITMFMPAEEFLIRLPLSPSSQLCAPP